MTSSATPDAEPQLPRKVRRVLERATRDMTDAAQAAHSARELAEQAAAAHAERAAQAGAIATEAIQARAAAERAARTEAQRRTVAEQLASETAEHAAMANATAQAALIARTEAEESALRASLQREAAEANARAQAEAATRAEARAQELAASLEEARAALLEHTRATLAAQQAQAQTPAPAAAPPAAVAAPAPAPAPDHRIQPEGVAELVEFRSPSSSALVTVLLGVGAIAAAAITVYEAYLDRLTTAPGMAAGAVTLLLVILVGRSKGSAGRVWLERGVLHVEEGDSHRRFDLSTPDTKVEMVGRPGGRRWKVLLLRKGMAPYAIDSALVDPAPFVAALEPWRPKLGR